MIFIFILVSKNFANNDWNYMNLIVQQLNRPNILLNFTPRILYEYLSLTKPKNFCAVSMKVSDALFCVLTTYYSIPHTELRTTYGRETGFYAR